MINNLVNRPYGESQFTQFLDTLDQFRQYKEMAKVLREEWRMMIQMTIINDAMLSACRQTYPQATTLTECSESASQMLKEKGLELLTSMVQSVIESTQCYCATLNDWLTKEPNDTQVAEYHLCEISSELDTLKMTLKEQSTKEGMKSKIIEPLIEQVQAITNIKENITSSLDLQQACTLQVILDSLIKTVNKLLESQKKDPHLLDELTTCLEEINQKINKDTADGTKVGITLGAMAIPLGILMHFVCSDIDVTLMEGGSCLCLGVLAGAGVGYGLTKHITENVKKQGRKEGEALLNEQTDKQII